MTFRVFANQQKDILGIIYFLVIYVNILKY